ncbi:prolyl oligopeptidase family serine peptidase [Marinilabiliaceae bacterium ANBcel2]|nr:prolyl oligopeptidase family serine peptidase [Marinilabiliaceae bacterium ANBcel2]
MKTKTVLIIAVISALIFAGCRQKNEEHKINYPESKQVDATDDYFGYMVKDPYRWLEDENSKETKEWIEQQNEITNRYLNNIPFKDRIKDRLSEVWKYTRQYAPTIKGDKKFYFRHDGISNHAVLYVKNIGESDERVLIDPNLFSEDGTTSLAATSISNDGNYIAYAISKGGSDWREVFIRDVNTGEDLDDHLKWVKFSGLSWDDEGLFYSRYDEPKDGEELSASNEFQKLYYHKKGTSQDDDILIHKDDENPQRNFSAVVDDNNRYLIRFSTRSTQGNQIDIHNLQNNSQISVDSDFNTESSYIGSLSTNRLLFVTNENASRRRVVAINPSTPELTNWEEIIPEKEDILRGVTLTENYIVCHYLKDVESNLKIYDHSGEYLKDIELPGAGSVSGINRYENRDIIYFNYTSYTNPTEVFELDIKSNNLTTVFSPSTNFETDDYTTTVEFFEADDGAQIPLFITHKKDIELNGNNPALLYGYGGFNIIQTPGFDISLIPWLENGGVYIRAHIRGGGEYGEDWYRAGTKKNKQRVFDDFIQSAEYLIENGYTVSDKLAIMGGSNGGLLVGAVANQRPDLFSVALPNVGVMDMLRYHKFTIGWAWAGDYGRSDDSKEMFEYLYSYSPLHNIPKGNGYPATLVTTADHDDRVVPAHSYKYIAALQNSYSGLNPTLIRIETKAGHGAGKPVSMQIEEIADKWAFTLYNMNEHFK